MKLGTLKSKIVVGTVAFGLLSSAGAAFAASDAGAGLQTWYNTNFNKAKADTTSALVGYAASQAGSLTSEFTNYKNTAKNNVKSAGLDEETRANGAINQYKTDYINAINTKEDAIKTGMPKQFDDYVAGQIKWTNVIVGQAATAFGTLATTEINAQGTASKNSVTTNVGKTKSDAAAALTQEIADTKAAIQALVDAEKAAATTELKANFDAQVAAKRQELTALINKLESDNKTAITTEGSAIEAAAKSEMDALVSGINK